MKKRVLSANDVPIIEKKLTLDDKVLNYIKENPNCTEMELYKLDKNAGSVARSIKKLVLGHKVKRFMVAV